MAVIRDWAPSLTILSSSSSVKTTVGDNVSTLIVAETVFELFKPPISVNVFEETDSIVVVVVELTGVKITAYVILSTAVKSEIVPPEDIVISFWSKVVDDSVSVNVTVVVSEEFKTLSSMVNLNWGTRLIVEEIDKLEFELLSEPSSWR